MSRVPPPPPPSEPTNAIPGSAEKIAVMACRAARHEPLFQPMDLRGCVVRPSRARIYPTKLPRGVDRLGDRYRARTTLPGQGQVYLHLWATPEEAEQAIAEAREGYFRRHHG